MGENQTNKESTKVGDVAATLTEQAEKMGVRPEQLLVALQGYAAAQGVDLGAQGEADAVQVIPRIMTNTPPHVMARMVGDQLRGELIFRKPAGDYVTIEADGSEELMDAERFVTWSASRVSYVRKRTEEGTDIPGEITKAKATSILKSDEFRWRVRPLQRVLPVRLPVMMGDGSGVRLLAEGYDEEHEVYVHHPLRYDEDWSLEQALEYLRKVLGAFPWGDDGRSFAVQITGMLAVYGGMLAPWLAPMFFYNANGPGSGKTLLGQLAAGVVYGNSAVTPMQKGWQDKLGELLNAKALANAPVVILDNIKDPWITSGLLDAWITARDWEFRGFHTQKVRMAPKSTITFMTSNGGVLDADLARRSLIVDLFAEETPEERMSDRGDVEEIDAERWLPDPKNRAAMMSALWAIIRNWEEMKMPASTSMVPSFAPWSRRMGGIVQAAGLGDPFAKAELQDGADQIRTEFNSLLTIAYEKHQPDPSVSLTLGDWAAIAREAEIYYEIVGSYDEAYHEMDENRGWQMDKQDGQPLPLTEEDRKEQALRYLNRSQSSKLGRIFKPLKGAKRRLKNGVKVRFSKRNAKLSAFDLEVIEAAPSGADPF